MRIARHAAGKRRELALSLAPQGRAGRRVERDHTCVDQLAVDFAQPTDENGPLVPSRMFRVREQTIEFLHRPGDYWIEGSRVRRVSRNGETGNHTLDVRGEAGSSRWLGGQCPRRGDADSAAPVIEQLEDVSFAEFDPDWASPQALCVVALAVPDRSP